MIKSVILMELQATEGPRPTREKSINFTFSLGNAVHWNWRRGPSLRSSFLADFVQDDSLFYAPILAYLTAVGRGLGWYANGPLALSTQAKLVGNCKLAVPGGLSDGVSSNLLPAQRTDALVS